MDHTTIQIQADETQVLTNNGHNNSGSLKPGTFYLSEQKISRPNWKLVIMVAVIALILGTAIVAFLNWPQAQPHETKIVFPVSSSPLGIYRFAAVAADAGNCSKVGTKILARGGSAVDAAIASCLCTGIYNMHNSGVGGGFLMTIWDQKAQKAYALDARETAYLAASESMFAGSSNLSSVYGPYAIAIPGEIAGYWAAHQRFGRLPWFELFEPAVALCKDGVVVNDVLESAIDSILFNTANFSDQRPFENTKTFLTNPQSGRPFRQGETITCHTLGATLHRIGKEGASSFYQGSIAEDIMSDLEEIGSPIGSDDLKRYKVEWRSPLETMLQDKYRLISIPPPGSGAILAFILNILSGYNFTQTNSQDVLTYHRIVESFKFGYGQRTILGDESFVSGMDKIVANLTSSSFAELTRLLINDTFTQPTEHYLPENHADVKNHGTSHISVIDADGLAVSVTSTINVYFGSGVIGKRTGVIFNNQMDDFSTPNKTNYFNLPPSPANFISPGKRPLSSMCPSIFLAKDLNSTDVNAYKVRLILGAAGGSRITSGTAYVATRILWFDEDPKKAIDALRIHHQLIPEQLYFEPDFPKVVLDSLFSKGHVNQTLYKFPASIMSVAQGIQILDNGTIFANSDYRKGSWADGF